MFYLDFNFRSLFVLINSKLIFFLTFWFIFCFLIDVHQSNSNYDIDMRSALIKQVPKPQISMPNSFSQRPGFYDDEEPSANANKNQAGTKPTETKKPTPSDNKKKPNGNAGDGSKGFV